MKKKILAAVLSMVLAVSCLTACGGKDPVAETPAGDAKETEAAQADAPVADGNTFTYAIAGDPGANVNVITTSDRFGLMTVKMVYSPLCMYNADGINWFLATSVDPSEDGTEYTWHLRDDVVWSDGEPFTADDVVFTYEAMEDEANAGWAYAQLVYDGVPTTIEKIDDYTVKMTLPIQSAASLEMLCNIFIMPKHVYEGVADFENNDINTHPVGTGPYIMSEYSAGSYVKFNANETYFKGAPSIDTFIYRIIENNNTAMMAIQSGEVDAWVATPAEVAQMDLEGNNLSTYAYSEGRVGYFGLNVKNVPDQKVRQAIFYALDKTEINTAVFLSDEFYVNPYTFLPPVSQFVTENIEKYETDTEKAAALLTEAGADGYKVTITFNGSDKTQSTQAALAQEQLSKAGFVCELNGMDGTAMYDQLENADNDIQMFIGGYIMGIDPDTFYALFGSGAVYNYHHTEFSEIDDLFAKGRTTMDEAERYEIYEELQQFMQDQAFFYPLVSNNRILVVNNRVSGVNDAKLVPVYTFEDTSYLTLE